MNNQDKIKEIVFYLCSKGYYSYEALVKIARNRTPKQLIDYFGEQEFPKSLLKIIYEQ